MVKGTFPRERAEGWDAELVSYLERNDFAGKYQYLDDGIFGGLAAAKPSIFPIYWSRPQMEAREDDNMVAVRGFLNSLLEARVRGQGLVRPDPRHRVPGPGPAP